MNPALECFLELGAEGWFLFSSAAFGPVNLERLSRLQFTSSTGPVRRLTDILGRKLL